jgi:hypothetical protein
MRRMNGTLGWFLASVGLTYLLLAAAAGVLIR